MKRDSLNQFSVTLAKLDLNRISKIFTIILLLGQASCSKRVNVNTEIFCPNNLRILVKFAQASDVKKAIQFAIQKKNHYHTSENHTYFKLKDGRSFHVSNIPPEKMINCSLRESQPGVVDKTYIHHPHYD